MKGGPRYLKGTEDHGIILGGKGFAEDADLAPFGG